MNKTYSKMTTQFETQAMAYSKLRTGLPYPEYLTRGYDGYIKIYKPTEDHKNPKLLITIHIRASVTAEEVGFFNKGNNEYLVIGRDAAWKIVDYVNPLLSPYASDLASQ